MVNSVFSIPLPREKRTVSAADSRERTLLAQRQFIGGPENQLAQIAAQGFADPQPSNNPLVFYGPTGRGKTLLAQGLVDRFTADHPGAKTVVVTGVDFARAYASAVAADAVADFRASRRQAELLLVDDVHQLQGKAAAQQELVLLIDDFVDRGKRVVATMNEHPARLASLDDRLTSRLCSGLAVCLAPPSTESRRLLIQHSAAIHGVAVADELIAQLACGASHASSQTLATPLQINSAVLRLRQLAADASQTVDAALIDELLAEMAAPPAPSLAAISSLVARHFQLKVGELRGPSRHQAVVRARGVAMLLARRLTPLSLQQIGAHFGGRDHTTVLHACRKTESLWDDEEIREAYKELSERLGAATAGRATRASDV